MSRKKRTPLHWADYEIGDDQADDDLGETKRNSNAKKKQRSAHTSGKDVGKNVLRWYQDEAVLRFSQLHVFNNLDTQSWTIISNNNSPFNVIYTPIQTDGTSCGVLCALLAYYFIMYGTLPNRLDFSCHPVHIEQMRLFMAYEVARLFSFPHEFTEGETDYFQREFENRERRINVRV